MEETFRWLGCIATIVLSTHRVIPLIPFGALGLAVLWLQYSVVPARSDVALKNGVLEDDLALAELLIRIGSEFPLSSSLSWANAIGELLLGAVLGVIVVTLVLSLLLIAEQLSALLSPFVFRAPSLLRAFEEPFEGVRVFVMVLGVALLFQAGLVERGLEELMSCLAIPPLPELSIGQVTTAVFETARLSFVAGIVILFPIFLLMLVLDTSRLFLERMTERVPLHGTHVAARYLVIPVWFGILCFFLLEQLRPIAVQTFERLENFRGELLSMSAPIQRGNAQHVPEFSRENDHGR